MLPLWFGIALQELCVCYFHILFLKKLITVTKTSDTFFRSQVHVNKEHHPYNQTVVSKCAFYKFLQ